MGAVCEKMGDGFQCNKVLAEAIPMLADLMQISIFNSGLPLIALI